MKYSIRNILPSDIIELLKIHKTSFDKSHFTSCFNNDLLKKYYGFLIDNMRYKIAMLDENHMIISYLLAHHDSESTINKFVKKNFLNLLLVLLANPRYILEKITDLKNKKINKDKNRNHLSVYLFLVRSEFKRKGYGTKLLECFEQILLEGGVNEYFLFVRSENYVAKYFYLKNGFLLFQNMNKSVYMIKKLL